MPDAIRHHLPSPQPSGTGVRIPAAVFGIALLARLLHLFFYKSSPYFIYPVVDAKVYLDEATRIAFGNWWQLDGVFYQAPLYQYFLAGTLLIGGLDLPLISRVIQALLGSATAVIVYLTARDLYQSRSEYQNKHASEVSKTAKPLIAGVLAAFYGPLIFFDCELLNPSLLLFFTYLCLYLLVREVAHGKKIRLPVTAIAGVCAGLSAITGGGILLFIPFFVYILLRRYSFNHALTRTITFICGIALVVLPVTVRNLVVGGEPVPISSNAGLNFFIGNNPDYESTVKTRPGIEWNRLANEPMDHDITTHRGYSSYFFKKSLRSILSDPAGYANVLYKKLAILVNAAEVPRNQEIYPIRSYSPVFAFLFWNAGSHFVFPFGFIFPFTCYFIIFGTWRKNPGYSLLLSFITSLLLFVFIFFVTSRYRLQAVPGLLILSSSGIWLAVNHLREKKIYYLLVLLPFIALSNHQAGKKNDHRSADTVYNIALSMERSGDHDSAIEWMEQAQIIDPTYHEAKMNLAVYLARYKADYHEALRLFDELKMSFPENPAVFQNMAECYRLMGDNETGEYYDDRAFRIRGE